MIGVEASTGAFYWQREFEKLGHKVKVISPKTATAVVAAIGKGTEFKNGRHFAAWLGLVPRQHSSGDRQGADEYDEKRRQASADSFYSWCLRCCQGCHE